MYNYEEAKKEYIEYCEQPNKLPVFAQPWYLNTVSKNWMVILFKKKDEILGVFPFEYTKTKIGFRMIVNPFQSKRLGIYVNAEGLKPSKKENLENEISQYVIDNLPPFDVFNIMFDSRYKNWRTFYNNGFRQETRYSYIINEFECCFNNISSSNRKLIKKKIDVLNFVLIENFDEYWDFFCDSYRKRGRVCEYTKQQISNLVQTALNKKSACIMAMKDDAGEIKSACVVFWDNIKMYSMFGTFDPQERPSSRPVLTYEAIKLANEKGLIFDFEGSMIPSVADYNRGFGARQEEFYVITKYSQRLTIYNDILEISGYVYKRLMKILRWTHK